VSPEVNALATLFSAVSYDLALRLADERRDRVAADLNQGYDRNLLVRAIAAGQSGARPVGSNARHLATKTRYLSVRRQGTAFRSVNGSPSLPVVGIEEDGNPALLLWRG